MIHIAVLGFGTVGGGVAELIEENGAQVAAAVGEPVRGKYILVRRDYPGSPYSDRMVRDINVILNDPEVTVVCEAMGGIEPAFSYAKAALEKGISFCTSNKELIDAHGPELCALAKAHECSCLFEASVAGGIPILRTLRTSLKQEDVASVTGILNGTCNYILTKMDREGMAFADALRQAQEQGFAEQDPTADVEGHDTARKLAILASMISGGRVSYEQIPCQGITGADRLDLLYAKKLNGAIKLLGMCERDQDGVAVRVAPCLVLCGHHLYGVNDVFNGVMVRGNMVGDLTLVGRGAGRRPTASAVVSDVIECLNARGRTLNAGLTGTGIKVTAGPRCSARYFIRMGSEEEAQARALFGDGLTPIQIDEAHDEFAFTSSPLTVQEVEAKIQALKTFKNKFLIVEGSIKG